MIQYNKIVDTMRGLVGFSNYRRVPLQEELQRSLSGVFFEGAHPLITVSNISEVAPREEVNYPEAEIGKTYPKGAVLKEPGGGSLYVALDEAEFTDGYKDSYFWSLTNALSIWIQTKVAQAIKEVIQNVLTKSILAKQGKEILENRPSIFSGVPQNVLTPTGASVISISPKVSNGAVIRVNSIRSPKYPVYVFNEFDNTPTAIIGSANEPVILNPGEDSIFNTWYFIYQREPGKTVRSTKAIDIAQFYDIRVFEASYFDGSDSVLTDLTEVEDSQGLDLDISAVCDYTEIFTKNKYDFVQLIKLQFGVNMLKEFIYNANARTNRTSTIASRVDVLYALDGDNSTFAKTTGLSFELRQAYEVFVLNTRGYNSKCLPCNRKGIAYRTVG